MSSLSPDVEGTGSVNLQTMRILAGEKSSNISHENQTTIFNASFEKETENILRYSANKFGAIQHAYLTLETSDLKIASTFYHLP